MKILVGALLLICGAATLADQQCDTKSYPMSTPTERFRDNGDGTLTDTQSGMMWMRCSLGQTWTGTRCSGKPQALTWKSAQQAATELPQAATQTIPTGACRTFPSLP
jgi:hypothetical protein